MKKYLNKTFLSVLDDSHYNQKIDFQAYINLKMVSVESHETVGSYWWRKTILPIPTSKDNKWHGHLLEWFLLEMDALHVSTILRIRSEGNLEIVDPF